MSVITVVGSYSNTAESTVGLTGKVLRLQTPLFACISFINSWQL